MLHRVLLLFACVLLCSAADVTVNFCNFWTTAVKVAFASDDAGTGKVEIASVPVKTCSAVVVDSTKTFVTASNTGAAGTVIKGPTDLPVTAGDAATATFHADKTFNIVYLFSSGGNAELFVAKQGTEAGEVQVPGDDEVLVGFHNFRTTATNDNQCINLISDIKPELGTAGDAHAMFNVGSACQKSQPHSYLATKYKTLPAKLRFSAHTTGDQFKSDVVAIGDIDNDLLDLTANPFKGHELWDFVLADDGLHVVRVQSLGTAGTQPSGTAAETKRICNFFDTSEYLTVTFAVNAFLSESSVTESIGPLQCITASVKNHFRYFTVKGSSGLQQTFNLGDDTFGSASLSDVIILYDGPTTGVDIAAVVPPSQSTTITDTLFTYCNLTPGKATVTKLDGTELELDGDAQECTTEEFSVLNTLNADLDVEFTQTGQTPAPSRSLKSLLDASGITLAQVAQLKGKNYIFANVKGVVVFIPNAGATGLDTPLLAVAAEVVICNYLRVPVSVSFSRTGGTATTPTTVAAATATAVTCTQVRVPENYVNVKVDTTIPAGQKASTQVVKELTVEGSWHVPRTDNILALHYDTDGTTITAHRLTASEGLEFNQYTIYLADFRSGDDKATNANWYLRVGTDDYLLTTTGHKTGTGAGTDQVSPMHVVLASKTGANKIVVRLEGATTDLANGVFELNSLAADSLKLQSAVIIALYNPTTTTTAIKANIIDSDLEDTANAYSTAGLETGTFKVCHTDPTRLDAAGAVSFISAADLFTTDTSAKQTLTFGQCKEIAVKETSKFFFLSNGRAGAWSDIGYNTREGQLLLLIGANGALSGPLVDSVADDLTQLEEDGKALLVFAAVASAKVDAKLKVGATENTLAETKYEVGPAAENFKTATFTIAELNSAATKAQTVRFYKTGTTTLLGETKPLSDNYVFVAGKIYIFTYLEGQNTARIVALTGSTTAEGATGAGANQITTAATINGGSNVPSSTPQAPQAPQAPSSTPVAGDDDSATSVIFSAWSMALAIAACFLLSL